MRLIRDGEGGGYVGGGRGRLYTYRYTVTTRMIPALRWAAMRAEAVSNRGPSAYQPNARPNRLTVLSTRGQLYNKCLNPERDKSRSQAQRAIILGLNMRVI